MRDFLLVFVPLASVSGIWFLKNWILQRIKSEVQHEYDQNLETHKANLKRDYEVQIERLKADLAERHLRFSTVFQKTTDAIAETYQNLLELQLATTRFVGTSNDNPSEKANCNSVMQHRSETFTNSWKRNRIFIPPNTSKKVEHLYGSLSRLVSKDIRRTTFAKHTSDDNPAVSITMDLNIDSLSDEIESLLNSLVDDFQKELGFRIEKTKKTET